MKNINFIDCLKQKGLKNTKCRVLVLDVLEQSNQPIPVEKVYLYLSKRGLMVSISTVYRTLETLVEKNLITKLNLIGEDKAFFEYKRIRSASSDVEWTLFYTLVRKRLRYFVYVIALTF